MADEARVPSIAEMLRPLQHPDGKWRPAGITHIGMLFECVYFAAAKLKTSDLWWRGHADGEWRCQPSVFRIADGSPNEARITYDFMQKARARHHSACPPRDDYASWLPLMRHYGLATRVLDWSESPLVALYFAASHETGKDGKLIALNPYVLNARLLGQGAVAHISGPMIAPIVDPKSVEGAPLAAAVHVDESDPRMVAQLTTMTVHRTATPLEEIPGLYDECCMEFKVPASAKAEVVANLRTYGVRQSTLFPDLQNLAEELNQTFLEKPPV